MHTYNDAIRKTIGSYVLYPGKSSKENKFEVYDELLPGVGAFAIRPGDTEESGSNALREFISQVIEFKASQSSRQNRKEYFENLVIQNPSDSSLKIKTKEDEREDSDLTMIGFVRESYYKYLNEKFLSKNNVC